MDTSYFEGVTIFQFNNRVIIGKDGLFFITDTLLSNPQTYQSGVDLKSEKGLLLYVAGDTLFATHPTDYYSYHYSDSIDISVDNGNTWNKKLFLDGHLTGKVQWVKTLDKIYASGREKNNFNSCIFLSSDKGVSWSKLKSLPTTLEITKIFASNDTVIIILEEPQLDSSQFFYSINNNGWHILHLPNESSLKNSGLQGVQVEFNNGKVYLMQSNFQMYESNDLGGNWTFKNMPIPPKSDFQTLGIFFLGDKIFLPTLRNDTGLLSFQLFTSDDDGISFFLDSTTVNDTIAIIPRIKEKNLFAFSAPISFYTGNGVVQRYVYYTSDSGQNWHQIPGVLPDVRNLFVGSDYIFMSGDFELWRIPKSILSTLKTVGTKSAASVSINDCFPNPSAISTHISYTIPQHSEVLLEAFDVTGRSVGRIASGAQDVGIHQSLWDTKSLPSGSYIIRLTACGGSDEKIIEIVH